MMEDEVIWKFIVRAIEAARSDDLLRAKRQFRGLSDKAMDQPYGESDRTPRQILEAYQRHDELCDAALIWMSGKQ